MASIEDIVKQMDAHDWDSVPNWTYNYGYAKACKGIWQDIFSRAGLILEGLVLDVCCGPVSLGAIYPNTIACDVNPSYIKQVRATGINGIIADFRKLPFDDKIFDIAVSIGPPLRPYHPRTMRPMDGIDSKRLVNRVTSEMVRVAKKKILLTNQSYTLDYVPKKFEKYIAYQDKFIILYNLKNV